MDADGEDLRAPMILDSHVHFWRYDRVRDTWITDAMAALQRDFLPADLEPMAKQHGVDGVIAVQASQSEGETDFLAGLAAAHPLIKAVVGWIDLRDPKLEERLAQFACQPVIRGWRHIVQAEPAGFLQRREFQAGVAAIGRHGYTYDLLIHHHQLEEGAQFIDRLGDQKVMIDHCAKPDIRSGSRDPWEGWMRRIARHPGVCCKLSGLLTEARWGEWKEEDFRPYLDVVCEAFGPDRLVFGSDWPVLLVSGDYGRWKDLVQAFLEPFKAEERQGVLGANAARFYGI